MEFLLVGFRVITIMSLLLVLVLCTGRRKIGELPVFDFLTIVVVGNIVGADIAQPNVPQLPTAFATVLIIGFQYLISLLVLRNRAIGGKLTFGPTVVIRNGCFVRGNMKRLRYTLDNILMLLREQGVFDLNEVEFAIIEDNGSLSILRKSQFVPITPKDMNIPTDYRGLSTPLVMDGKVCEDNLRSLGLEKAWLLDKLAAHGIKGFDEAFYVELNPEGKLYVSRIVDA